MQVREGMTKTVLTIGPGHTLRDAARMMSERNVGAAIVIDPDLPGPGIVTERDLLASIGAGENPDEERVANHQSTHLVFAGPEWSLERAASEMAGGGFRHLIVIDDTEVVGLLSMRDIVRVWVSDGATSSMPAEAAAGG
jgi:CBS domain-containing protein